jgi:hypothetical protein
MDTRNERTLHTALLIAAMGITAAIYSHTIFSNLCIDGDTLNWATSLAPLKNRMTLLNCIAITGWFTKFHLMMFSLVYGITTVYSLWGQWDYLVGFKICTLICAVLTVPLIFFICKNTMRHFPVMLVISLIPLYTLGYSWMITTCDDNVLANFFNLIFVVCLLIATGAIKGELRERHCLRWAFITGIAAGLSMASHLKNIVALPLILALCVVKPPATRRRVIIGAAGLLGLILSFGLLYGLYWIQSAGEPVSSKIDFWVFHRVPGRFYFTTPRPPLLDQLTLAFVGIRSSLCAFQELFIHTNVYDVDILGSVVVALFFLIYFASACRMRQRHAVRILFFLFLLDAGHSLFYDSWVVERWDSFTLPVYLTIGIYWDSVLSGGNGGRTLFQRVRFSLLLLLFFGTIVWSNVRSTNLLLNITNNSMPCRPSAKAWRFPRVFYFYFDHRGAYDLARRLDGFLGEGTYFLSLKYMQAPSSHVYVVLDQYLTLYSKRYRSRLIEDPNAITTMVEHGELRKLLYLDTVKIPIYTDTARCFFIFDPAMTTTIYSNSQLVLKEAVFRKDGRV